MQRINYQLLLDKTIEDILKSGERPSLLLHACCAPCSSYVLEYLSSVFNITLFYYNPNISPESEYEFRVREVQRLLDEMKLKNNVFFSEGVYEPDKFYEMAKGLELLPEGGERCFKCYRLRLSEAAEYAEKNGFDYFTTTLSISPYKNADKLNEIGSELAKEHGVKYLYSDFKKKNGYKRSIELSEKYSLYRQNYCGCVYSYETMKRKERNGTR
ncbi:MAG: epoxyqueuosine reductase QueH [Clostridiales bacterium]|nr:epoxyqueuosine reductase QueH [Clostridiales bacterium]